MSDFHKSTRSVAAAVILSMITSGCSNLPEKSESDSVTVASVDLRVTDGGSPEKFLPRDGFTVPRNHKVGDTLFPYEGIGWENELVGYRLYLDERSVTDVFGKTGGATVLQNVDYRDNYHDPADWGLDVLKVGPSLGVGGLGLYRNGTLERFGPEPVISVSVTERAGNKAEFILSHDGIALGDSSPRQVSATYSIKTGSPLTWVSVKSDMPEQTLASGLVTVRGGSRMLSQSPSAGTRSGAWRYVATWGDTASEAGDGLGLILFFRDDEADLMPTTKDTYALRFRSPTPTYAFAGVWAQGPMDITDQSGFLTWADLTLSKLNR